MSARRRRAPLARGDLVTRVPTERPPVAVACMLCGSTRIAALVSLCAGGCKGVAPTPLDSLLRALGMVESEFAELSGIPKRTLIRAATGERMSARVAKRLALATGIPASVFREEE